MVHHANDHIPTGAAVSMSESQLQRLQNTLADLLDPIRQVAAAIAEDRSRTPAPAVFSSEQFDEIKALLQPGFELSSLLLAEYNAAREPPIADRSGDRPSHAVVVEPLEDIVQPQPANPSGLE